MSDTELPKIFDDVLATGKSLGYGYNYRTKTPWSDDQYVYAATGITIVRMESPPDVRKQYHRTPTEPQPVSLVGVGFEHDYSHEPVALPDEPVDVDRCGKCDLGIEPGRHIEFAGCKLKAAIVRLLQDAKALVYLEQRTPPNRIRFVAGAVEGVATLIDRSGEDKTEPGVAEG